MSMRNARALLARMMAEADDSSSDDERAAAAGRQQRPPVVVDLTVSDEDDGGEDDDDDDAFDAFLVLQEHLGEDDDDDSESLFGQDSTDGSAEDNLGHETSDSRGDDRNSGDEDDDDAMEEIGSPVHREFLAVRTRNGRHVILHDDDDSDDGDEDNMASAEPTFVGAPPEPTAPLPETSAHVAAVIAIAAHATELPTGPLQIGESAAAPPRSPVPATTAPTTPATPERTLGRGRKRRSRSKTEVVVKSQPTECPVCMEACTLSGPHRIVSLKCGHVFGQKCIERWLVERKKCPVCNHAVRKTDLRPLFSDHVAVLDSTDFENLTQKYEAEKSKRIQVRRLPFKQIAIQSELERSKKQVKHMMEIRQDELFKWERAYSELQRQLATERQRVQSVHANKDGHLSDGVITTAVNPTTTARSCSQKLTPQTAPQSTSTRNVAPLGSNPIVVDGRHFIV